MSRLRVVRAACPACGQQEEHVLFASLNGARLPAAAADVLAGRFQLADCAGCGAEFHVEAEALYVDMPRRLWIVHLPLAERARWAEHERRVTELFAKEIGAHPDPQVAELHAELTPRLVFGQRRLAEALRVVELGLDARLLECLKAVTLRDNVATLLEFGPVELVLASAEGGVLRFELIPLAASAPVAALDVPRSLLASVTERGSEFQDRYAELFSHPWIDVTRYLLAGSLT